MEIRTAPPVNVQPECRLHCWGVLRVEAPDRCAGWDFLVGHDYDAMMGRTTSALHDFDPAAAIARTQSGRRYQLIGEPNSDLAELAAFVQHMKLAAGYVRSDVTALYWNRIQAAQCVHGHAAQFSPICTEWPGAPTIRSR